MSFVFRHGQAVRTILMLMLANATPLFAQNQEGKLIDRLLRPNTSMTNPAQNHDFVGEKYPISTPTTIAKTFPPPNQFQPKSLGHIPALAQPEFAVPPFRTGEAQTILPTRRQLHTDEIRLPVNAPDKQVAAESGRNIPASSFAETRPFRGEGKSQKALHAYDRPL